MMTPRYDDDDDIASQNRSKNKTQKSHITYPSKPFLRLSGLNFHPRAEFAVLFVRGFERRKSSSKERDKRQASVASNNAPL